MKLPTHKQLMGEKKDGRGKGTQEETEDRGVGKRTKGGEGEE